MNYSIYISLAWLVLAGVTICALLWRLLPLLYWLRLESEARKEAAHQIGRAAFWYVDQIRGENKR